ncbi:MAG: HAMP domain-containing sensor histidine kinase [Crocinitomicaceae bacterium]|nr:HAMP domain-containing sensor histidine kinase [Crocinitomicaceae bacterium]
MNKRTALIFYVLSVYVVVQFVWWGYHLIELTSEVSAQSSHVSKRVIMIMGEGGVFLLLLLVGIWQIRRSIRKELKLSERQNNFLLSVTHELKTPLAANKLYLQTIAKRDLSKEQSEELLKKAIEENTRLERMIDNILNASRLENNVLKPEKESINLSELIEQVATRFNAIIGKDLVQFETSDNVIMQGDRFMIETILNNLVENALKYSGKELPVMIYATNDGQELVLGVKDEGPGIDKEFQQVIFKKFFRIGNEEVRTQKGSGLGLFIVSELVRMHGGTVKCLNNEPKGTNFQIRL